jgi:hypothetical protein
MQRRKFIRLTAIGGTATVFAGLQCNLHRPSFYKILDKPGDLSFICDLQTIREIGLAYRLQKPEENESHKLEDLLLSDSAGRSVTSASDDRFVQTLINNKIEQDFEKANTVVVKGWILAVTEARQCALFAIHNQ